MSEEPETVSIRLTHYEALCDVERAARKLIAHSDDRDHRADLICALDIIKQLRDDVISKFATLAGGAG